MPVALCRMPADGVAAVARSSESPMRGFAVSADSVPFAAGAFPCANAVHWCGAVAVARNLQADKVGTDSDHIANLGAQPNNLALDRRGDFDRCLVGHDRRKCCILADKIADLDVPLDEFGFGDTLADVGQSDHMLGHLTAPSLRAARGRRGLDRGSSPIPVHADKAYPNLPRA